TNPRFDAEAVAEELSVSYGFNVTVVHDATRRQMLDSLNAFASRHYGDQDQLLVFFAGHGSYDEQYIQDGFVVAADSKTAADDTYKDTMVQYNWIRRRLANAASDHVLLVLDVCYGGTFAEQLGSGNARSGDELYQSVSTAELVNRKLKYRTRRYVTSGGKERVPDGVPGEHTPFVRRLLEALRTYGGEDGVLTMSEVYSYLERVDPEPRAGEFDRNEPGSDFLFIAK
ncbi:MAG: caspase family protein, partial [Rhodothermales bacterium]|nr:caspase family protein [Rhodothermales bacterium]